MLQSEHHCQNIETTRIKSLLDTANLPHLQQSTTVLCTTPSSAGISIVTEFPSSTTSFTLPSSIFASSTILVLSLYAFNAAGFLGSFPALIPQHVANDTMVIAIVAIDTSSPEIIGQNSFTLFRPILSVALAAADNGKMYAHHTIANF